MQEPYARWDPSDDARFYAIERKVTHIEAGAIAALRSVYERMLPPAGRVLDLMSSWRSHLPDGLGPVTGLGMNAAEMADNPQLDAFVVHDLNAEPRLPFDDDAFDACVCAVSVQYLISPVDVFADVARVVRTGGPVIVGFSNRCFPTKAVAIWMATNDAQHRALVQEYFRDAGLSDVTAEQPPSPDDPMHVVWARVP